MAKRANFQIPDFPRNRPTVPQVKPLVDAIYDGGCKNGLGGAGGCLHIVLDDRNLDSDSIRYCLSNDIRDICPLCAEVAILMLQMTKTQRRKL